MYMRGAMLPALLLGLTPAFAQEPGLPESAPSPAQVEDARKVTQLNQVILDNNRAIRARNEAEETAYRAERARYEAALAENGKARAEATAAQEAFVAASRQHDADMARWRASPGVKASLAKTSIARQPAIPTVPAPGRYPTDRPISVSSGSAQIALDAEASRRSKLICHTRLDTGSLVKRTRSCATEESWKRRLAGEQAEARDMVRRNGDGVVQP